MGDSNDSKFVMFVCSLWEEIRVRLGFDYGLMFNCVVHLKVK
jgi:hypothetical protein